MIYGQEDPRFDAPVDSGRCRHAVSHPPHYLHHAQCQRKSATLVGGVEFCVQHGRIVAAKTKEFLYRLEEPT